VSGERREEARSEGEPTPLPDPELQEKVERLKILREIHRRQRRLSLFALIICLLLVRPLTLRAPILGLIPLAVAALALWKYFKCRKVIRMIDGAVGPYRKHQLPT